MSSLEKPPQSDYWRSLAELEKSPEFAEFVAREFPVQAEEGPVSRRTFMQIMAASFAFAGLDACRWQKDEIVPLSRRPEGFIPGMQRQYSTTLEREGVATPLRVASYDGRPIKIEGNASHPYGSGGTRALDQATILEMYDPDRSRQVKHFGKRSSHEDFARFVAGLPADHRLRILSEATSSPTVLRLRQSLLEKFPSARWHEWEPLTRDAERDGTRLAFGAPMRALPRLDRAKVIVALDGDFLVDHPASLRLAGDWAQGRRPEQGPMSRLYAVESTLTSAGGCADHRLPLRAELVLPFTMALDALVRGGDAPEAAFLDDEKVKKFLRALAEDVKAAGSAAVLLPGPRQPAAVHAICARLHDSLGAIGASVEYVADADPERPSHLASLRALAADVGNGQVDTILILGGNPVFDAPADLDFAGVLGSVESSIHVSVYDDETSAACSWHVPRTHFLEEWGDARTYDGTVTLAQPLIEPLWDGRSVIEVLAGFLGLERSGEELVRETIASMAPGADWRTCLHDGWVPGSASAASAPSVRDFPAPRLSARQTGGLRLENGKLEVVFTSSSHCHDGRHANNGWMIETPDPQTRLTWDNAALISPATAEAIGIVNGALVRITLRGERDIMVPAYVMPGQAPYSIALAVGHGRTRAGHVGGLTDEQVESIGFDVYPLRTVEGFWISVGADVSDTGETHKLATVQDHWAIDNLGRGAVEQRSAELVRTTTAEEYADPTFHGYEPHGPPLRSLFADHAVLTAATEGHRWGMATDLSTCIGCNACAVACQAENNVPIVGKEAVMRTREMAWIRVDRYFRGDPDDPEVVHQPVTCQQCEKAPCEQVCPVGATIHSDEGLNEMVYNRCVGTRYCLNNCPYKVRRFNFFEWRKEDGVPMEDLTQRRNDVRHLMFNPEVTVRSRGVMEKCSFCVQRIEKAKIGARNEGRAIADGEVQSACMQACPTQAIVFGDLSDPNSRVSKLHQKETYRRGYALLAELNTIPRNRYLARVKNPNPALQARTAAEHAEEHT